MLRTMIAIVIFLSSFGVAQASCSDILPGLMSYKKTFDEKQFEDQFISWLSMNDIATASSVQDQSLKMGLKFPIEGIPIGIESDYDAKSSSNQYFSKSLAKYLSTHSVDKTKFFQEILSANPDVVAAWRSCETGDRQKEGFSCTTNQIPESNEIELLINFNPSVNDQNTIKITGIDFPEATLQPYKNYVGKTIVRGDDNLLTFVRKSDAGGRIQIQTENIAYRCEAGDGGRFLPIVHEKLIPYPCLQQNDLGQCTRCEVNVSDDNALENSSFTAVCPGMKPSDMANVTLEGAISIPAFANEHGCEFRWVLSAEVGGKPISINPIVENQGCTASAKSDMAFGIPIDRTGNVKTRFTLERCQKNGIQTCEISNARILIYTAEGQAKVE